MKYFISILIIILIGCTSQKKKKAVLDKVNYIGAPTLVYKTKKDYNMNVPVLLNDTKDSIVSYPSKMDLKTNETFAYPVVLHKGYLLDNRGIGINVAFLKYTYEEYFNLSNQPTEKELLLSIIDKDPLKELYNLGNRYQYKNLTDTVNSIIDNDDLKFYKIIK